MTRRIGAVLTMCLFVAYSAGAHVSPMVQLVGKGDFIRAALPGASQFFERKLDPGAEALNRLATAIDWKPSPQEIKVYVGRDAGNRLVGSVVFLRVPSEHGPVGVGVCILWSRVRARGRDEDDGKDERNGGGSAVVVPGIYVKRIVKITEKTDFPRHPELNDFQVTEEV